MNRVKQIFQQSARVLVAAAFVPVSGVGAVPSCRVDHTTQHILLSDGRYAVMQPQEARHGRGEQEVARVYAANGTILTQAGLMFDRVLPQGKAGLFRCLLVPVASPLTQDLQVLDVRQIDFVHARSFVFLP